MEVSDTEKSMVQTWKKVIRSTIRMHGRYTSRFLFQDLLKQLPESEQKNLQEAFDFCFNIPQR